MLLLTIILEISLHDQIRKHSLHLYHAVLCSDPSIYWQWSKLHIYHMTKCKVFCPQTILLFQTFRHEFDFIISSYLIFKYYHLFYYFISFSQSKLWERNDNLLQQFLDGH